MKLCLTSTLLIAAIVAHASDIGNDEDGGNLRRRLIVVDPAYAPEQTCKDGKPAEHTLEMKIFTDNYPEETMFCEWYYVCVATIK